MKKYTKFNFKMALQEEIDFCNAIIKNQPQYAEGALKAKRIAEKAMKMPTKKAFNFIKKSVDK